MYTTYVAETNKISHTISLGKDLPCEPDMVMGAPDGILIGSQKIFSELFWVTFIIFIRNAEQNQHKKMKKEQKSIPK